MARANRETWAKRVEAWTESGRSAAEFAAEIGVTPKALTWWKWQLRREGAKVRVRRVRTGKPTKSKTTRISPLTFVEMSAPAHGEPLEVVLMSGVRIRVPIGFDAGAVARLVDVLERHR